MSTRRHLTTTLAATALGALAASTLVTGSAAAAPPEWANDPVDLRVATYNLSLSRNATGERGSELTTGPTARAWSVCEIIQRAKPDLVMLNDCDYSAGGVAADLCRDNALAVSQGGA